jgi:hypothetical protein
MDRLRRVRGTWAALAILLVAVVVLLLIPDSRGAALPVLVIVGLALAIVVARRKPVTR